MRITRFGRTAKRHRTLLDEGMACGCWQCVFSGRSPVRKRVCVNWLNLLKSAGGRPAPFHPFPRRARGPSQVGGCATHLPEAQLREGGPRSGARVHVVMNTWGRQRRSRMLASVPCCCNGLVGHTRQQSRKLAWPRVSSNREVVVDSEGPKVGHGVINPGGVSSRAAPAARKRNHRLLTM
jgi:hypothetical protein